MGLKEKHYLRLREKLDRLGYAHPLSLDSLPLVQRLVEDFESLQSRLEYFKTSALHSDSKCGALEQSVIPIKRENENLIRDNNELHRIIIHERDKYEKTIQELRTQLQQAETAYSDLEFAYMEQLSSNGILHQDILSKNEKLLELEGSSTSKDKRDETKRVKFCSVSRQDQTKKSKAKNVSSVSLYISKTLAGLTKSEMMEEIEKLKNNNARLKDAIDHNTHQVEVRDEEIRRLGKLLEKKAPLVVQPNLSCNCHLSENLQFESENCESLKIQLEEAHKKLHRAIEKSASLMDRLEVLENKFKEEKSIQLRNDYDEMVHANNRISYERKSVPVTSPASDKATAELTARVEVLENKILKLERTESPRICYCEHKCDKQVSNTGSEKSTTELTERIEVLETKLLRSETSHSQRVCSSCDHQCSCCCDRRFKHKEKISDSEDSDLPLCSHKNVIRTLLKEKKEATEELSKIQNELLEFKERVAGLSQAKHNEKCNREVVRLQLEDKIKSSELEKKSISEKLISVTSKLRNSEQIVEKLIHKCENLTTECANWKAKYNHIKVLNEHLEMTIKNSEDVDKNKEADIKSSVKKIQSLEDEKISLENALQALHKERANLRNNIHYLDKEKDSLLINLDEKAVHISKLESAFKQKNNYITNLEHEISNLQAQLQTLERMLTSTENKARSSNKDVRKMEAEICTLESCKENLLYENRRLQNDLSALTQDNMQITSALEASKLEVENLKLRLQTYVEEVRRVDELLQIKENERAELLEQFKALSAEASNLEVNNQSLEYESTNVKKTLKQTNDRVQNLEWEVESKNSLVKDMEDQVTELTSQIHGLHSKINEKDQFEIALTSDLEAARNLCSTLEKQKRAFNDQIVQLQQKEQKLQTHLEQLKHNNESLEMRIAEEEHHKKTLEEVLASSREEAMEKSMCSHDLRGELGEMQQKVRSLENELYNLNKRLHESQRSCEDFREENTKLKRDLTNEKYERTRADDSLSFSTSL